MNFNVWISFVAAAVTAGIAVMALWRDPRSFVHRVFAVGMALFALEAGLSGLAYQAPSADEFLYWQRFQLLLASFLPALWLLFSVSFARTNYPEQISRWKWVLILSLVLPVSLVTLFGDAFFAGPPVLTETSALFIRIGWSGYLWHLLWVILSVMILMNLERTFRHATGHMRWQTKFMFLGIGGIFGTHLFTRQPDRAFQRRQYRSGYRRSGGAPGGGYPHPPLPLPGKAAECLCPALPPVSLQLVHGAHRRCLFHLRGGDWRGFPSSSSGSGISILPYS